MPERLKNLEKKREKEAAERKERERQVFSSSKVSDIGSNCHVCLILNRGGRGWSC